MRDRKSEGDMDFSEIKHFIDCDGRLTSFPAKHKKKLIALWYLADKIEENRQYSEHEINELLNNQTCFCDPATLRRELYNKRLINRTPDCRSYQKEKNIPTLEEFVENNI